MSPPDPSAVSPAASDSRYDLDKERILLNGSEALVRLCLMQRERDRRAGLDTAGYVSGYPGSPLGGIDGAFRRAQARTGAAGVVFRLGLNEELAATAVWGTQQAELHGEGRHDGVFALWYGKGPGVDRSGDVFRHANAAGSSRHGGVLVLSGDDHEAQSSSLVHQSELHFVDLMMSVLHPAGLQEIIDFGLLGWAMSRFSGLWVNLKGLRDTIESTAVIDGRLDRIAIETSTGFAMPPGGLNIRLGDDPLSQDRRLHGYKIAAAQAFIAANRLNRVVISGGEVPRIGVLAPGKAYLDVLQALEILGLSLDVASALGFRLVKIGCPWPLSRAELAGFAQGLETLIVVEEKRPLIETQARDLLYGLGDMPRIIGKRAEDGAPLFAPEDELDANHIAIVLGERLAALHPGGGLAFPTDRLREERQRMSTLPAFAKRTPHFCPGCPHSASTVLPEGARGMAGIGCHYMVQWMDRNTQGFTQMGGEGATWIGEAPFSKRRHLFQNIGDGTFQHSGMLAIRAAVAAGVDITYKLLFNGSIAMTGGQPHEGGLSVADVARQVASLGVARIVLVSDEPGRYPKTEIWPRNLELCPREDEMAMQTALAATSGVTVLIHDQTCAIAKRSRRKRVAEPASETRVVINERICDGCGDCSAQSNCVAIQPVETPFGRKRRIDQSSCNIDLACLEGFCPALVTVRDARRRSLRSDTAKDDEGQPVALLSEFPEPAVAAVDRPFSIVAAGIGGTGIVTIASILSAAAHREGKGCGTIDMAGLAQKGGAVASHIRITRGPSDGAATRIPPGGADLVLGFDMPVTAGAGILGLARRGEAAVIVNIARTMSGDFTRDPDFELPTDRLKAAIEAVAGRAVFIDAGAMATAILGNPVAANILLLGVACQLGLLPVGRVAIEQAIAAKPEGVADNLAAFGWGRVLGADAAAGGLSDADTGADKLEDAPSNTVEPFRRTLARQQAFLAQYQNIGWARRFEALVAWVEKVEGHRLGRGSNRLAAAVAPGLFKLMNYKDEYEVARLMSDGVFERQITRGFEGERLRLAFHMTPPIFARRDAEGHRRKMRLGGWMMPVLRVIARGRILRGTPFDPVGWTRDRRIDRQLLAEYEILVAEILDRLQPDNLHLAVELAKLPLDVRGFGHVRERNMERVAKRRMSLLERFRASPRRQRAEIDEIGDSASAVLQPAAPGPIPAE